MLSTRPRPWPPYSIGTAAPNRPSSASLCQRSSGGKSTFLSIHRTYSYVSSFRQNLSRVSAMVRWSSVNKWSMGSGARIGATVGRALRPDQRAGVLPKSGHRGLQLRRMVEPLDGVSLQSQGGVQARRFQRPRQDLLGHAQGLRALRRDVGDDLAELFFEPVVGKHAGQEPHLVEVLRAVVTAPAVDHLACAVQRHRPGDPDRPSPTRQEAEVYLRRAEDGGVRRVYEVAHQRELESAGQAMAMDLRDHYFLAELDGLTELVAVVRQPVESRRVVGKEGEDAEIPAGAEARSGSGQNCCGDVGLISDPSEGGEQLGGHGLVDRVVLVRPVEGDIRHPPVDVVLDGLVLSHGRLRLAGAGSRAAGTPLSRGTGLRPWYRSPALPGRTPRCGTSSGSLRRGRRRRW